MVLCRFVKTRSPRSTHHSDFTNLIGQTGKIKTVRSVCSLKVSVGSQLTSSSGALRTPDRVSQKTNSSSFEFNKMTSCLSFFVAWLTHAAIVTASRRERLIGDTGYVVLDQPEYESSPEPLPDKELECSVRLLAYQYALDIQPHRGPSQPATYDALFIDQYCNGTDNKRNIDQLAKYKADLIKYDRFNTDQRTLVDDVSTYSVYVDPNSGNDANDGSLQSPFGSLQRALESTRSQSSNELNKQIIIRKGILFLNETITLSPSTFDSNLMITSYPQEEVWISGGIRIVDGIENLKWERYDDGNPMHNIWRTKIDVDLQQKLYNHSIYSLFTETPHRRLIRARYPNGDLEVFRDGKMFISATNTIEWFVAYGSPPKQIFKNLSCAIPENEACLNYSAFKYYNDYTIGYGEGTVCDLWTTESFWCGLVRWFVLHLPRNTKIVT